MFALIAVACAAGWYYDRNENRPAEAAKIIMDGVRDLERTPGGRVRVVILGRGNFPIVCELSRFEPAPLPKEDEEQPPSAKVPQAAKRDDATSQPTGGQAKPSEPAPEKRADQGKAAAEAAPAGNAAPKVTAPSAVTDQKSADEKGVVQKSVEKPAADVPKTP